MKVQNFFDKNINTLNRIRELVLRLGLNLKIKRVKPFKEIW